MLSTKNLYILLVILSDVQRYQSIHYDMEDLIEQANEIQESLGRSYGVPDEVDEADLQAGELPFLLAMAFGIVMTIM